MPAKLDVPGIGTDQDDIRIGDGLYDRGQNVGEYRTDDESHLVAVDQRLHLGDGNVRLQLVISDQDLRFTAAELAAKRLDRKLKAVALLLPGNGPGGCRQRGDDSDLELLLRTCRIREQHAYGRGADKQP